MIVVILLRRAATTWGVAIALAAGCAGKSAELCTNGDDEDQDDLIDCADEDCWVEGGVCAEDCATIFDEDGDGFEACGDPDCWLAGGPCSEDCRTDDDEDADGLVACADPDCWVESSPCDEVCGSGEDEDGDGATDCEDGDCWQKEQGCPEVCQGGGDEDADASIDCDDPDCWDEGFCAPSYALHVRPIFMVHCFGPGGACHSDASASGGLSVESHADMPLPSIYCAGLTKGACSLYRILEPSMPEDCLNCVPREDVVTVERWVDGGILP